MNLYIFRVHNSLYVRANHFMFQIRYRSVFVSMLWNTHQEMRANRAKLGKRHRHADEIEAKQLDALDRKAKSRCSQLPL